MAYYGGGQAPFNGPQGQGSAPQGHQLYGNQGPQGSQQQSGMYSHGGPPQEYFNEYSGGNNMHSSYGQPQQGYYEPHHGHGGPGGMGSQIDPRSHIHPMNQQPQSGRGEATKILRNPFPEVSKDILQKGNEMYDPSYPTGPPSSGPMQGHGQFNQRRIAPPPPMLSSYSSGDPPHMSGPPSGPQQMSMPGPPSGPQQMSMPGPPSSGAPVSMHNGMGMPPESGMTTMGNATMYNNGMYGNTAQYSQAQAASAPPTNYPYPAQQMPLGNSNSNDHAQQSQQPKMQVMTGIVSRVQPGAFGMVSEEIFFQENVVSGPLPKVGDKVVVEAEEVSGMPFKFNAKRVTRLDVDLVREDKNSVPPPSNAFQQQQQPQQQYPQQYQNYQPQEQPPHHPPNRHPMNDPISRYEQPNFGPLPSLPDSLNLPKPVPPPNLASVLPASSLNSAGPLKSILKRKGSPSLRRNPPPPPMISKNGKEDSNQFKSSAPSSLKQNVFSVDLERDVPRIHPPLATTRPIEFPEYTFFNKERPRVPDVPAPLSPRITRLLPRSPIPEFGSGRSSSIDNSRDQRQRSLSHDRSSSRRHKSRSRSKSPRSRTTRRTRSRSVSPRRLRRSRSPSPNERFSRFRSPSPKGRRRSRSISPRNHRRSRSISPRSRRRSRSISPQVRRRSRSISPRNRRRSRSISPRNHRRTITRSTSHERNSDSRVRGIRHHSTRSRSRSLTRSRCSPSRRRSNSPEGGPKVFEETITHGIVVKRVSSDLFPKLVGRTSDMKEVEVIRRDGKGSMIAKTAPPPPAPIKFQISNPAKPAPASSSSIVPNPTFKSTPSTYLHNAAFNITKTVANPAADTKGKKKSKEQEPAFRIIDNDVPQDSSSSASKQSTDEKIKQWEAERQALKSKSVNNTSSPANLLKNPVNILHLKQTIQNDLQELRSKGNSDTGKKLLENPIDIEKLKQSVQKELNEIKSKETSQSTSTGENEKHNRNANSPVINKNFDENVEQRLRDLRSKFENQIKDAKAAVASTSQKITSAGNSKSPAVETSKVTPEKQKVILVSDNLKDKNKSPAPRIAFKPPSEASAERSRDPRKRSQSPHMEMPPYDEKMEQLQEEIHRQRFVEEEQRLKSIGDVAGLDHLYYMDDRRRRRVEERHLTRIRKMEIRLKKEKKYGELADLRSEWGPSAQRWQQEIELRQMRLDEERKDHQFHGQAEAIKRQEFEYQRWLEEEAAARSRNFQENARASRGCEGRVLRRRTPSPNSHRNPPSGPHHGPPPEPRGAHPLRRRSRSPSFERYKEDWHRRHPRDRSPPMNYEQFVVRYPIGPPPGHPMHPDGFPPNHPNFHGPMPPQHFDPDGFIVSMDKVARRQEELMHREMEIQHRMEMAQRRLGGEPPPFHRGHGGNDREEIRRFVVPRR